MPRRSGSPRFPQQQTAVLISQVLERALLPAEIQQALLERAEGNPLYAEQFAQLYLERGSGEDLPLPETLQGIVAARLDALGRCEGAPPGCSSHRQGLLDRCAAERRTGGGRTPARTRTQGIPDASAPLLGRERGRVAFAHMLLRDVAYGRSREASAPRSTRLVAEWIESLAALRTTGRCSPTTGVPRSSLPERQAGTAAICLSALASPCAGRATAPSGSMPTTRPRATTRKRSRCAAGR